MRAAPAGRSTGRVDPPICSSVAARCSLPDVLDSAPSVDQLFLTPGHIETVIEQLAEAREELVLGNDGNFFDGEQETADIFSNELGYKDWPELVGNLKRAAEAKITALGPHQLVLIADEPHSSCLVLKPKKGPFIAIDTGTDYHDMTDEEFSAAVLGYDKVTHQILGDTDVPKVLIAYLRLLKERDLDFPDDEYYIQKSVEDSIEKLGIEGPPGIFAIVHKTVTKVGKKKMHTFDTVLWDEDEKEIADIDARFVDGQTIRGDEDWVFFWDGYEWINKKKSEDVESSDEDDSDDDSGKDFLDFVPGSNVIESDWVVGDSGDCNQCGLVLSWDDCQMSADLPGDLMLCEGCFILYDDEWTD